MSTLLRLPVVVAVLAAGLSQVHPVYAEKETSSLQVITASDYARAEKFLRWIKDKSIKNDEVKHHWIGDTDTFWYTRDTDNGKQTVIFNAATGKKGPAFDHAHVAGLLAKAADAEIDPNELNVQAYMPDAPTPLGIATVVQLMGPKKAWMCVPTKNACIDASTVAKGKAPHYQPGDSPSPDGKWAIFTKDHNVYLRSMTDGTVKQLTTDGEENYSYGKISGTSTMAVSLSRMGVPLPPVAVWAPDSHAFVIHKLDERKVEDLHLLQYAPESGSARPVLHTYKYAMAGDENVAKVELSIFNVADGSRVTVAIDPLDTTYMSPIAIGRVWWSDDQKKVHVVPVPLYAKKLELLTIDATSGA
ncbi:MAG: DPP IV N-terminal domain-containing protein, partial [Kordiimonadaceae bacterium]|nr:DPP IV N-terminal domain-containing protein [Kordiimonadaceae bacterium]